MTQHSDSSNSRLEVVESLRETAAGLLAELDRHDLALPAAHLCQAIYALTSEMRALADERSQATISANRAGL